MRHFRRKGFWIARQHGSGSFQFQSVVNPRKAFQKPAAEKSRAAGDEYLPAAQFFPESRGVRQNMIEIGGEGVCFQADWDREFWGKILSCSEYQRQFGSWDRPSPFERMVPAVTKKRLTELFQLCLWPNEIAPVEFAK